MTMKEGMHLTDTSIESTRAEAMRHIARGWAVFLLATDGPQGKIPFKACDRCSPNGGTCRDGTTCTCLLCHAFYGATLDPNRFDAMLRNYPGGYLALRTGTASQLLVIDVESRVDTTHGVTGLEVLDQWEQWTNGVGLPQTLTARSDSGGLHLYYRSSAALHSMTRVLPGIDIKCEGGLVGAVGSRTGRRTWVDPAVPVADAPADLITWLGARSMNRGPGGGGGRSPGYDFKLFTHEGCPDGHRDSFFNDLLFRLRKADTPLYRSTEIAYEHWSRVAQPPEARTRCEWWHIEYKIRRVWGDVHPDADLGRASDLLARWQAAALEQGPRKIGRVTVVPRGRR